MSKDAQVASALAHWAPRLVTNGIPLTDFQEVTGGISTWNEWCAAWCARAEIHEALGREALAEGFRLSAGEHLNRAAVCYHFGKFLFVEDPAQMKAAHERAVRVFTEALPLLRPPGERVEIPYEGATLYGVMRKPAGVERPPVLVMIMGLDSAKEEMANNQQVFLDRGIATLTFDGPGQGEGEYEFAIRHDYEVAVAAVIGYVETRADLDADRVALWGVSLGGYYAARAAAFEPRVRAAISLAGPYALGRIWDDLPPLTREALRARTHSATPDGAREKAARLDLTGVAERITCPLYVMVGKQDRVIPWRDGERLAGEASGPVLFNPIEDGNHVANNRAYKYRTQSADWLALQLGLEPS